MQVGKSYEIHYVHSSAGMDNDATVPWHMLGGKVCFFGAVFSTLQSFQDDVNADLLADGLGGERRMLISAVTSSGSRLLHSGFAVFRAHAGAANGRGLLNPMIVVQGQIFQIVNGAATVDDMLHGWTVVGHDNSVMYPGSTTGQSHDNEVCSPYSITWHVDKDCHQVRVVRKNLN